MVEFGGLAAGYIWYGSADGGGVGVSSPRLFWTACYTPLSPPHPIPAAACTPLSRGERHLAPPMLPCKAKRHYLLTFKSSRYCFLTFRSSMCPHAAECVLNSSSINGKSCNSRPYSSSKNYSGNSRKSWHYSPLQQLHLWEKHNIVSLWNSPGTIYPVSPM